MWSGAGLSNGNWLILMPLAFGYISAAREVKITFWIDAGQKDIYSDIDTTLKVIDSLQLDVKISDSVLVLTPENQEDVEEQLETINKDDDMAKLCEILASEGISIVIDWSYQHWQQGIDFVRAVGIPYIKVDRILRPFLDMFSDYMRQKNANNVAMIFQNKRDMAEAMLHIVNGYTFRTLILNANEPQQYFVSRLKSLRPSPSYYAIFARGIHMSNIFKDIDKGKLFERASEWHFVYLDPRDRLFKYKKQVEHAMRFTMNPRSLCRSLHMKDDYCLSGFTFQRGMLLDIMRTLSDIARGTDYLEHYSGDCNGSIESLTSLTEPQTPFDILEFQLSNFMIYRKRGNDRRNRRTIVLEHSELPLLSYNVNINVDFYSNKHDAATRLATWRAGELTKVNKTISPAKRFFRIGTAFALPWSFYRTNPNTGEVLLDTNGEPIWDGYCIDFIKALSRKMNFDYKVVGPTRGHLGQLDETGRWDGVVGDLVSGETDFAVAALKMYSEREEVIDFLPPYFDQTGISIVMRKPLRRTSLFKFMTVLRLEVWLSIIVAIVATALLTWFLDRFSPYSSRNNRDAYPYPCREFTLRESIWFSLTSFTPQGGGEAPKAISGRILVAAYWLFVVLMLATFTANLAAFLTVERMQSPVQSLEQLARQSRINYTVVDESDTHHYFMNMKFAEDTLYRMWKELALNASKDFKKFRVWDYPIKEQYGKILLAINTSRPVRDAAEGFRKVDEYLNADYAFIHDSSEIKYEVTRNCNFTEVGDVFAEQPYAVAVQQGSHLGDELSYTILELQKERLFENLRDKYWNISLRDNCPVPDGQEGITLDSLGGVFLATLLGLVIAMVTLAVEVAYYKREQVQLSLNANVTQVKPIEEIKQSKMKIWHIGGYGGSGSGSKNKLEPPPSFEVAINRTKKGNIDVSNVTLGGSEFKPRRHGLQSRRELGGHINQRRDPDGYLE